MFSLNTNERICELRNMLILEGGLASSFDLIAAYCCSRFKVDIALVSLVDVGHAWFRAPCPLTNRPPGDITSFCTQTLMQGNAMVIRDAKVDERFYNHPQVVGAPFIRFYAGVPLRFTNGKMAGSLCLLSPRAGRLEDEDYEHLLVLARMISEELMTMDPLENCRAHCLQGITGAGCVSRNTK